MQTVVVTGGFDDLRSRHVRFLEEAARHGAVHVALWSDAAFQARHGRPPKFPEPERRYLLESLRFVERVSLVDAAAPDALADVLRSLRPAAWVVDEASDTPGRRASAAALGIKYRVIPNVTLTGFPVPPFSPPDLNSPRRRAIVTGCYDWFHSGHVRFFEEVSALADLYVVVGHDANIRLLKGAGHPLLPEAERLYMVRAVRWVCAGMISTGHGWMDAEPEIALVRPHLYVVNEEGDKPEKQSFCAAHGIQYVVLKRLPKAGLPKRDSTALRGF
jgi:cytidyltransferase-like protein